MNIDTQISTAEAMFNVKTHSYMGPEGKQDGTLMYICIHVERETNTCFVVYNYKHMENGWIACEHHKACVSM